MRRSFRRGLVVAVVPAIVAAIAIALASGSRGGAGESGPYDRGPCRQARRLAVLAAAGEPGDRLAISGRVFSGEGTTPAAGVIVYAYQADATGHYAARPGDAPRLRAWARTAADGSFEFRTIRPAPYPGRRIPAHVHFQLWAEGVAPRWGEDLTFDDDPLVTAEDRSRSGRAGRFGSVRAVTAAAGGTRGVLHDLRLETGLATFEDNTRHGLAACAAD